MKKNFLLFSMILALLALGISLVTATTPVYATASFPLVAPINTQADSSCAGKIKIHNDMTIPGALVQMEAINDPRFHLDVPAGKTYDGYIPYNQPMRFIKEVPNARRLKLVTLEVDWRCDFGDEANIWVNNATNRDNVQYTLPQGFNEY